MPAHLHVPSTLFRPAHSQLTMLRTLQTPQNPAALLTVHLHCLQASNTVLHSRKSLLFLRGVFFFLPWCFQRATHNLRQHGVFQRKKKKEKKRKTNPKKPGKVLQHI